jgi:hypothetical protein
LQKGKEFQKFIMNFLIIIIVKDFCMIPNSWEKQTEIRIWLSIKPKNEGGGRGGDAWFAPCGLVPLVRI